MKKIPKQAYTAKFKEQAVKWIKEGKGVSVVAKEPKRWGWSSKPCATG